MGTDIHLMTQVQNELTGQWELALVRYPCPECKGGTAPKERPTRPGDAYWGGCFFCYGRGEALGWGERNYKVFSQLAGLRGPCTPVVEPRGLPADFVAAGLDPEEPYGHDAEEHSSRAEAQLDQELHPSLGEHTRSWLLLAELLAYDRSTVRVTEGWLTPEQYDAWDGVSSPPEYCLGASGSQVQGYSEANYRSAIRRGLRSQLAAHPYVIVHWNETDAQYDSGFWTDFVPALTKLGPPDRVRIVFGFDS